MNSTGSDNQDAPQDYGEAADLLDSRAPWPDKKGTRSKLNINASHDESQRLNMNNSNLSLKMSRVPKIFKEERPRVRDEKAYEGKQGSPSSPNVLDTYQA